MVLRIWFEKSCDLNAGAFVSTYNERCKKIFGKFYFAYGYLRIWYDFLPQQQRVGGWKKRGIFLTKKRVLMGKVKKREKREKNGPFCLKKIIGFLNFDGGVQIGKLCMRGAGGE